MIDPATIAVMAGGKKAALLWPLFIGMTAQKAGTVSIDILKNWGAVIAAVSAAIYMGGIFEKVNDMQVDATEAHRVLNLKIEDGLKHLKETTDAEWAFREYKIDKSFKATDEGERWTFSMAKKANDEIMRSINENSNEDNVRYATIADAMVVMGGRMTRLFEKIDVLNKKTGAN